MNRRTKKIGLFMLGLSMLCFSGVRAQEQGVLNLDLQTALKIANDNNPTMKIADLEIQRVDYAKKESIGSLLPNVSATGQYTNSIMKSVMFMPASFSAMMGGQSYMEIGYKNSYTGTISASMPLVNFALWESIKAKQNNIDLIIEQARSSKIDMAKQVKDAYYNVLLAEASLDVLTKSINNAKETLKTTKAAYEQGVASEYDYLSAQVQVNNLNPTFLAAKNGVDLAALQLKMLLSLPSTQAVKVTETLSDYEDNVTLLNELENRQAEVLMNNSTMRQLDLNIKNLQHTLRMTKYQHLPSLAAFGQYVYTTQAEDFKFQDYNWVNSAAIGLSLNIPIFSGNTIINQTKQVKIALKELELQKQYASDGQNLQYTAAIDNMRTANEQLIVNREAIAQAERGYEIAKVRYSTGTGTILELNNSELALTQSRLNYQQSLYNYLSAQAALEQVLGRE
ncbi:MAG: TolC family protein [Bacteroidales bacterium]|nr:TolC family protein [Bacteroidales bacterium]